ncbi:haloacid dehalogenase [Bacteroidia bacterium]|nr:haloacid dehalogenase [Bacteroidia bacterium]
MIKNIVFDLGGVVVDWNPEKIKREYTGDQQLASYMVEDVELHKQWSEFDRGALSDEEIRAYIISVTGISEQLCIDVIEYVKTTLTNIPKTIDLIKELYAEGYRLFCLSNMPASFYDYLKGREVFNYFEGKIISALELLVKPDPAIFKLALSRHHLQPEETLFIDDLESNVRAAATLGIHTVYFGDKEKGYQLIKEALK